MCPDMPRPIAPIYVQRGVLESGDWLESRRRCMIATLGPNLRVPGPINGNAMSRVPDINEADIITDAMMRANNQPTEANKEQFSPISSTTFKILPRD